MRLLLSISFVSILLGISGCNKSNVQPKKPAKTSIEVVQYSPEYGEVSSEHPAYLQASRECELNVYKEGVILSGVLVKDRNVLNKASSEHMFAYIKNRLTGDLDINGSYHGASAAVGVATGNVTTTYSSGKSVKSFGEYMKEYQGLPAPKEISRINELQEEYVTCMRNEKNFKPIRTIIKNSETGEIISSTDLK